MTSEQQMTQHQRRLSALLDLVKGIYGTEKLVLKAGKLEALSLIHSQKPARQLLGLQRLVFENPTLSDVPTVKQFPQVFTCLLYTSRCV